MFWAKYRGWFLLLVYVIFFGHAALWHHFGYEKVGHLGFGCIFSTMRDGVVTAGTVFTLLIFIHALFFGGLFCGWMCHWGILQDLAAWIMKKLNINPPMAHANTRLIPWFWFLILIGQVVLFWAYSGFPTSLSFNMSANPVWFMVPRSILLIVLTSIISGFALIFLFGERAFCRTICVFRLWFNWFERVAPHKIRRTKECVSCEGECSNICPMGLPVVEEVKTLGHIKNPECIKCFRCVGACPDGVLKSSFAKNEFHEYGPAIEQKPSISNSINYLQTALAVIMVTFFGFQIGGNISLSLGFLIGIVIARMLHDKAVSWFELVIIAILGVGIYYRFDLNDATSLFKGLIVLAAFLLAARLLKYSKGLEFIGKKAANFSVPPVVTILFLGLALFFGAREIYASAMIHKAKTAIARKDYPTYVTAMMSCADFVPKPSGAYFDLANAQLMLKETDEAVKHYKKSLELNFTPEAAEVILDKLKEANEQQAWLEILEYVLANHPQSHQFKLYKAQSLVSTGNAQEAQTLINEYISLRPDDVQGYVTLGNLQLEENKETEALAMFEKAYKISPAEGAVNLAAYYGWLGDYDKAETYFAEAIKHFPEDPVLRVERGVNFALQNDIDQAINSWNEALKIDPDFAPAKANLEKARAAGESGTNADAPVGPFKSNIPESN
jgi:polyferredoxin/tetratricopeptide (TPR) repeat protein